MKSRKALTYPSTPVVSLRTSQRLMFAILIYVLAVALSNAALAQTSVGSAFTYQGQLQQSDNPAGGTFDMEFTLYDGPDPVVDTPLASIEQSVAVSDGLFTVELDFGGAVFDGDARWLQIGVRENTGDPYTYVSPLQPLTTAPYALYALSGPPVPSVPPGAIVMWAGSLASIPAGWALCDGANSTPDLRDRFILGVLDGENPGATGGTASHVHSIGSAGAHTHSGTTEISNNNLSTASGSSFEGVRQEHRHNFTTNEAGTHAHSSNVQSHLPPYYKLAFIMKLP